MRLMGIDYGEKRIGVAITDERCIIASPLAVINRIDDGLKSVADLIDYYRISRVVVGLPLNMDGSEGPKAGESREFAGKLKSATETEVELWDERLTTAEVEKLMISFDMSRAKRRKKRDSLSACVILKTYMEAHGL